MEIDTGTAVTLLAIVIYFLAYARIKGG